MPIPCSTTQTTRRARHYFAPKGRSKEDQNYIDECERLWVEARISLGRIKKMYVEYEDRPHLLLTKIEEELEKVLVPVTENFEPESMTWGSGACDADI